MTTLDKPMFSFSFKQVASYDSVIHSSNGDEVYDLYKMYDPEDVKPELAV